MKSRIVTQYICEMCNKRGLSRSAMVKHEQHCTLNPDRLCKMCEYANGGSGCKPQKVMSILPNPAGYHLPDEHQGFDHGQNCFDHRPAPFNHWEEFRDDIEAALPKLWEEVEYCPACMLAALRQRGIPGWIHDWRYKKEVEKMFEIHRQENCDVAGMGW